MFDCAVLVDAILITHYYPLLYCSLDECLEISGVAVSEQKFEGAPIIWAHNDGSAGRYLLAFSKSSGELIRRYEVPSVARSGVDVEDLSLAPCGGEKQGMCVICNPNFI